MRSLPRLSCIQPYCLLFGGPNEPRVQGGPISQKAQHEGPQVQAMILFTHWDVGVNLGVGAPASRLQQGSHSTIPLPRRGAFN